MLIANADRLDATVVDFFSRMNDEEVDYALLRNYELYPKFGHDIDLVVRWSDLPKLMAVATSCARDHGWSVLAKCDHWARSSSREHTIQIQRFYSIDPPQYLQIDAFHSFIVLGLPFFDEDTLLRDRVKDDRGFYRINEHVENLYRLFQIAKVAETKGTAEKVKRYSERALTFWGQAQAPSLIAESPGLPNMSIAIGHLRSGDFESFKKEVRQKYRAWWIGQLFSHPVRAGRLIFNRLIDVPRLWLRPCGFVVRAFAENNEERKRMEQIVKRLAAANIFFAFTLSSDFRERQRVRNVGGIVVEWARLESADIIIDSRTDDQSIMNALLTLIVGRHAKLLDQRKTSN